MILKQLCKQNLFKRQSEEATVVDPLARKILSKYVFVLTTPLPHALLNKPFNPSNSYLCIEVAVQVVHCILVVIQYPVCL